MNVLSDVGHGYKWLRLWSDSTKSSCVPLKWEPGQCKHPDSFWEEMPAVMWNSFAFNQWHLSHHLRHCWECRIYGYSWEKTNFLWWPLIWSTSGVCLGLATLHVCVRAVAGQEDSVPRESNHSPCQSHDPAPMQEVWDEALERVWRSSTSEDNS